MMDNKKKLDFEQAQMIRHLHHAEQLIERRAYKEAEQILVEFDLPTYQMFSHIERGILTWVLGEIAREQHDFEQAQAHFNNSMTLLNDNTVPDKHVRTMVALGKLQSKINQHEEALHILNQAYRIALTEKIPTPIEISLLTNLGMVHGRLGELYSSIYYLQEAHKLNQAIQSHYQTGQIHMALGVCYMQLDRYQEAKRHFEKAIYAFQLDDDLENQAGTYLNLGILCQYFLRFEETYHYLKKSIQIYQQTSQHQLKQKAILKLAKAYFQDGEFSTAHSYAKAILLEPDKSSTYIQQTYELLIEIELAKHNYPQAMEYVEKALANQTKQEQANQETLLLKKAQIHHHLGQFELASKLFLEAISTSS
jgi:tetratricopeptide (TPR) repeat protein